VKRRPSLPGGRTTAGFCIPLTRFAAAGDLAREVVAHHGRAHVAVAVGVRITAEAIEERVSARKLA
jgi:hypothetical protein